MSKDIEAYLEQLKAELAGCDPATIQDALSDAEEHLRTALDQVLESQPDLSESEAIRPIIARYGTPGEIAAAYIEIEARITPPLARPKTPDKRHFISRFFGVLADPRAYAAFLYMLFSLATGIVYFTWAITGLSLSAGLIVLIIGLPFFGLFLLSVRGLALVEGRIIEALLGVRMPRRSLFSQKDLGWWGKFKALITGKHTWTTLAYMILQLPLGIIYFTLFIIMLSVTLWCIGRPILELIFDLPWAQIDSLAFYTPTWLMPLIVIAGVLWLILTMHFAKLGGRLHGALAKAMLVRD